MGWQRAGGNAVTIAMCAMCEDEVEAVGWPPRCRVCGSGKVTAIKEFADPDLVVEPPSEHSVPVYSLGSSRSIAGLGELLVEHRALTWARQVLACGAPISVQTAAITARIDQCEEIIRDEAAKMFEELN